MGITESTSTSAATKYINILILGDSATGKHSYVKRLTHHIFPDDTRGNNECDIINTEITLDENKNIPIRIFNIAGSQRGKTKINKYFKNIDACIIMFDVTRAETYDNVLGWKDDLEHIIKSDKLPCILLANKCELEKDEGLNITTELMNEYCQATRFISWFEISNKDNIKIEESIQFLIRKIIELKNPSTLAPVIPPSPVDTKREYVFKIVVIGDKNTGKTAFIERYVQNTFATQYRTTIGADIFYKAIRYNDDITIRLHIWDIAGEERFGSVTRLFYKDAVACIVAFDVSKPLTLTSGVVKWNNDFDDKVGCDDGNRVPFLLIGNKCDLKKEGISGNEVQMADFCRTHKFARWYETSAKENINIKTSFLFLVEEILRNTQRLPRARATSEVITITDQSLPKHQSTKCCSS